MKASNLARQVINEIESRHKRNLASSNLKRWTGRTAENASIDNYIINIMLVLNRQYVSLAEICVRSFLYFHPNSHFSLHCDALTRTYAEKTFADLIRCQTLEIMDVVLKDGMAWQELKLDLILKMSGTDEYFLDADLRWNGSLKKKSQVTFFVEEFKFNEKSPFREICAAIPNIPLSSSMKNLSIFSFGGYVLDDKDNICVKELLVEFKKIVSGPLVGDLDKANTLRVIEQFVLSTASENWRAPIQFVKSQDKPLDGGLVESCYFGATGGIF